jgi:hypothetical protein
LGLTGQATKSGELFIPELPDQQGRTRTIQMKMGLRKNLNSNQIIAGIVHITRTGLNLNLQMETKMM